MSMEWARCFSHQMDEKAREREDFLQKYYHHLVKCITPSLCYSWLITKKVLSQDEQEEVEGKYQTRSLRAGYLIDLIMRKGEKGFVAFMECIEYIYPDLYQEITGKEPRPPPDTSLKGPSGCSVRRNPKTCRTKSSEVMVLMASLMQKLTEDVADKKTKLNELQELMTGVKEERDSEENEKSSLYVELDITREKNEELKVDNEELRRKLQAATAERDAIQARYQEMRIKKDELFDQCNQLREKLENMELNGDIQRKRSTSCRQEQLEKMRKENQELKMKLDLHASQCKISNQQENSTLKMTDQRSQITELEKKIETLMLENSGLQEQCTGLEEICALLQENNNERKNSIKHFTSERDQYQKLYEEVKKQLEESLKQNEDMSAQCRVYHERICKMSERMQQLDDEIVLLKAPKSDMVYCPGDEPYGDLKVPPSGLSSPTSPTLRIGYSRNSGDRRNGSYRTLGMNDPLIVFASKEIESHLFQQLKKSFSVCPFDTCPAGSADSAKVEENPEFLVFKKSPTSYSFVRKESLRQKDSKTVLVSIPVHCVRQMQEQLHVNPIVIIVKFKGKGSISEYTHEEEILNRYPAIKFDVITVSEELKTSFTNADANSIINEMLDIVHRENLLRGES